MAAPTARRPRPSLPPLDAILAGVDEAVIRQRLRELETETGLLRGLLDIVTYAEARKLARSAPVPPQPRGSVAAD